MIKTFSAQYVLVCALLIGCSYEAPAKFTEPLLLAGETVSESILNEGQSAYAFYCQSCHGRDGDGRGPASVGLRTPPRDFRTATFKFGGVIDGLPHDEDLERIVLGGLDGTAMVPWFIPERDLNAILQFIKTFSPEDDGWRDETVGKGERIDVETDPWKGKEDQATRRGETLYHGKATCHSCHPSYATVEDINKHRVQSGMSPQKSFRDNLWMSESKLSESFSRPMEGDPSCVEGGGPICGEGNVCRLGRCEAALAIVPPDFTVNKIRSGADKVSIYRIIASGIPGTAMPQWKDSIPDEDIWAIAYYVEFLSRLEPGVAQKIREEVRRGAHGQDSQNQREAHDD